MLDFCALILRFMNFLQKERVRSGTAELPLLAWAHLTIVSQPTFGGRMTDRKPRELIKVSEMVTIDEDEFYLRAERSQYWADAYAFYMSVKDKLWITLRPKQETWIRKIEKSLEREVAR